MLSIVIGLQLIACWYFYETFVQIKSNPEEDRAEFFLHVAEIRDLIHRCRSLAEWWTLDQEIDWLEQTWSGRINERVMIEETGKLYDKWFKQREKIAPRKTA